MLGQMRRAPSPSLQATCHPWAALAALSWSVLGLWAAGCQPEIPAVVRSDVPTDTAGQATWLESDAGPEVPDYPVDTQLPTVVIATPTTGETLLTPTATLSGTALDDTAVAALTVQVGAEVEVPAGMPAADGSFAITVALFPGLQTITVRAYDVRGNVGQAEVDISRGGLAADLTPPTLSVSEPLDGFEVLGGSVWVRGSTDDDVGVVSVTVQVGAASPIAAPSDDGFATFALEVGLLPGIVNDIVVAATDSAGRSATLLVSGTTLVAADATAPVVTITSPSAGATTDTGSIVVSGTASDDTGIAAIDVRLGDGPYNPVAESAPDFSTWSTEVTLTPGDNLVKVRATDLAGLTTTAEVVVTETSGAEWGPEASFTLNWEPAPHSASTFELDRDGLAALVSPEKAEQLVMLELDLAPVVTNTLDTIREACGTAWWIPNNLEATCPADWGQSEINLWRLVTMTPGNVNVAGTSIEGMAEIASTLSTFGLLDDFDEILAAGLGIGVHDLIVSAPAVAESLLLNLVGTHPNILPGAIVPVTVLDALSDMATFSSRFGPKGDHPGFLDPFTPTYSEVLTPDFKMFMAAESNIHWHEGVALAPAGGIGDKAFIALLEDLTGPTLDDVLEFDFLSPDTFWVEGLAPDPTVDMAFRMSEDDDWLPAGTSPLPLPYGNSPVWSSDPWLIEYVLADAAFRHYEDRRGGCDLCSGSGSGALLWEDPLFGLDETELVVGRQGYDKDGNGSAEHFDFIDPNPPGWLRIWTLFGLGSPPAPQYVWDMIMEVSERRLLDGGVSQGLGDVRFELVDIPVGLTGPQIAAALRPTMEEQKSELSDLLLGDYANTAEAPADMYLARGVDDALRLHFVIPSDPLPEGTAAHPKVGFFANEALSHKVSVLADAGSGDVTHEKLLVGATPQTVYVADRGGHLHRLDVGAATGDSVSVSVRRWVGGP